MVVDTAVFALLFFSGQITEAMASQRDFLTSARLRLAENSYSWADSDETMKKSLSGLHLFNALNMDLNVIEAYTRDQAFSVFGFSIEPGTASTFAAAALTFLQYFFVWDLHTVAMNGRMYIVLVAALLNMAVIAGISIKSGI
jgi:hypothetical protein